MAHHPVTWHKTGSIRSAGSMLKDLEGQGWGGTTKAYLDIAQNIQKMTRKRSDSQYIAQESIYTKETNDWYSKMLKGAESFVHLQKCMRYTQAAGNECHCLDKHLFEDFCFHQCYHRIRQCIFVFPLVFLYPTLLNGNKINQFTQAASVLLETVNAKWSPCPHPDPLTFCCIFSLCPVKEGSDRVVWWAPDSQPRSAHTIKPQLSNWAPEMLCGTTSKDLKKPRYSTPAALPFSTHMVTASQKDTVSGLICPSQSHVAVS